MTEDYRKFTLDDAICWKLLPSRWGCGEKYLWSFKYAWIRHNKENIKREAAYNNIPAFLLAGVALREVGGKDFLKWQVYSIRSWDWSGASWRNTYLTVTKHPSLTSMGAVAIQLRRAAESMGIPPSTMSDKQWTDLALSLQSNAFNLFIVGKHLQQLLLIDNPNLLDTYNLSDDQIRMVGTRYWHGPEKSTDFIKRAATLSGSYGSFILRHKQLLLQLLQ